VRYGNGWIPIAGRPIYGNFEDYFPHTNRCGRGGRSLADAPITMFGAAADYDQLMRYKEAGRGRAWCGLAPEGADKTVPVLDKWAELIRRVNG